MKNFLATYNKLNAGNLELLATIYAEDIVFVDPVHKVEGLQNLTTYFNTLYQNINSISFDFAEPLRLDDKGYVQWQMRYSHPRIGKGEDIEVDGTTFVVFNKEEKVSHHRDYFDLGNMIYQHLPLLGSVVKAVNRRLKT